jgi:hypothetical protein
VGEKRDRAEESRGREVNRRDWRDDDDLRRNRRHGTRRHRSLSGWVRHSRCRGGLEDCISSTGRYRPSTPFRRRGVELAPTPYWVPKVAFKKSVSFADPLVTASWPLDAAPASVKFKRGASTTDTNIQAAISFKVSVLDSVAANKVFYSSELVENVVTVPPTIQQNQLLNNVTRELVNHTLPEKSTERENQAGPLLLPTGHHSQDGAGPVDLIHAIDNAHPTSLQTVELNDFIASISGTPEPPILSTPPNNNKAHIDQESGNTGSSTALVSGNNNNTCKRMSARLAAKRGLTMGRNYDAISKAQELLIAKFNNSAARSFCSSSASNSNTHDTLFEQFANQFTRPLTKDQMEAIMELVNQGEKKVGGPRRGCKVAPVKVPSIKTMQRI